MSASDTFSSEVVMISAPSLRAREIFFDNCSLSLSGSAAEVSTQTTTHDAFIVYESLRAHRSTETECGLGLMPTTKRCPDFHGPVIRSVRI